METMRHQFDQLFNEMTQPVVDPKTWQPAIELQDTGDQLVLRAELPGMTAADLNIEVTREGVSIQAEHRREQTTEQQGMVKSEFRYGHFRRVVQLPVAIQNDKVQAEYKDGILTLTLPKVEESRNKVVKVNITPVEQVTTEG
jgi:HSP20 family protein